MSLMGMKNLSNGLKEWAESAPHQGTEKRSDHRTEEELCRAFPTPRTPHSDREEQHKEKELNDKEEEKTEEETTEEETEKRERKILGGNWKLLRKMMEENKSIGPNIRNCMPYKGNANFEDIFSGKAIFKENVIIDYFKDLNNGFAKVSIKIFNMDESLNGIRDSLVKFIRNEDDCQCFLTDEERKDVATKEKLFESNSYNPRLNYYHAKTSFQGEIKRHAYINLKGDVSIEALSKFIKNIIDFKERVLIRLRQGERYGLTDSDFKRRSKVLLTDSEKLKYKTEENKIILNFIADFVEEPKKMEEKGKKLDQTKLQKIREKIKNMVNIKHAK